MPKILPVEKSSLTEKSIDCLYFSKSWRRSEYILVRYKDPKKIFRRKIRYDQSDISKITIHSEENERGFFSSKNKHKICLVAFNDHHKILIRVKAKLYKKLEFGIFKKSVLDDKIIHDFQQEKMEHEHSNDMEKKIENIYKMWKGGMLTRYEFKIAKKRMLNY